MPSRRVLVSIALLLLVLAAAAIPTLADTAPLQVTYYFLPG
jgi:hypothetical protein